MITPKVFIDNNFDFVDNDDDDILDNSVEDALEVPVPEVLDKVMVQTADELHDRIDHSLFSSAKSVQLDLLTTLNRIRRAPNVAVGEVMKWAI